MTEKQQNVINYLKENNFTYFAPMLGITNSLRKCIFSDETIKNYSHIRKNLPVINLMTYSYLGKMVKKKLINYRIDENRDETGYYI